jgi:hypothetical protein
MPLMDVTGDWILDQSNRAVVDLHIDQEILPSGTVKLHGRASHSNGAVTSRDLTGRLAGSGEGSTVLFVIPWSDGTVGEYHGTFGPFPVGSGGSRLTGNTFNQRNPGEQATWVSRKLFGFGPV